MTCMISGYPLGKPAAILPKLPFLPVNHTEVSSNGGTPKFAGWFFSGKIPSKWMMTGGTPILGNPHMPHVFCGGFPCVSQPRLSFSASNTSARSFLWLSGSSAYATSSTLPGGRVPWYLGNYIESSRVSDRKRRLFKPTNSDTWLISPISWCQVTLFISAVHP